MIDGPPDSKSVSAARPKRRSARLFLVAAILLTVVWVGSYVFRAGASYKRPGDFATHVPIRFNGMAIDRGNIEFWHETADAPPPNAQGIETRNMEFSQNSGFSAGIGRSTEHMEERFGSLLGMIGFYHYHPDDPFDDRVPYGMRSTIDAWFFPFWLIAIVSWIPAIWHVERRESFGLLKTMPRTESKPRSFSMHRPEFEKLEIAR